MRERCGTGWCASEEAVEFYQVILLQCTRSIVSPRRDPPELGSHRCCNDSLVANTLPLRRPTPEASLPTAWSCRWRGTSSTAWSSLQTSSPPTLSVHRASGGRTSTARTSSPQGTNCSCDRGHHPLPPPTSSPPHPTRLRSLRSAVAHSPSTVARQVATLARQTQLVLLSYRRSGP